MRLGRVFTCGIWISLIVGVIAPDVLLGQTPSVRVNSRYTYDMLDPTTNINRKLLVLLDARRRGAEPEPGGLVTPGRGLFRHLDSIPTPADVDEGPGGETGRVPPGGSIVRGDGDERAPHPQRAAPDRLHNLCIRRNHRRK